MVVEDMESELAQVSVQAGNEENGSLLHEKENGIINKGPGLNEPIKFGSHGLDEPSKGEENNVAETNFPKDAVDEWPAPKQIHYFYFIKYRSYEDPKLKAKLDQADKDVQKKTQVRSQLIEKLRAKRSERAQVIAQMKSLNEENKQFWSILDEKRKEMEPLHQALGKLRTAKGGVCSSEEELNDLIKSMQYRIQHESIPLTEEKQILRDIKQLEGTRVQVIANAAMRAKIQESLGEKGAIQDQVKLMGVGMDGVRKDHQVVKAKRKQLEEEKDAIDKAIKSLEDELTAMTQKRDEGYDYIIELKKQREEKNACYRENRNLLTKVKDLAVKKDIEALKEICDTEVDKFVSKWSSTKAFREDYERRIFPSLDMRQLSRDGRMRNPNEKPLVLAEVATPSETESVAKTNVKRPKEDSISPPQHDSTTTHKAQKEANGKPQKEVKSKPRGSETTLERVDLEDEEGISFFGSENPQKDAPAKENKVDEAKLKEMRREEEMEKNKQALERKKKLAEKAAAKAALKAQKEAEKMLKDREKKAKKKAAASAPVLAPEDSSDQADEEVAEPEKAKENVEAPVLSKRMDRKENNNIRHRIRTKGSDSFPKTMIKRKKSTNYWMWAAPAGISGLMLLVIGYIYLL